MSTEAEQNNTIDVENEPVDRTAAALIQLAIQMKASDLFFLTNEKNVEVRLRQMGIMRSVREYSHEYGRKLMSHFKAMADIDITERFRPIEGRWVFNRPEGAVDSRSGCSEQRAKRVAIYKLALNRNGGLRRPQPLVSGPI